jgi:putative ABC transport system permease protein
VVKDFNYASARNEILPLVISGQSKGAETLYIKLQGTAYSEIIQYLERAWKKIYPAVPFQHWFMDEEFGKLYKLELQMGKIFNFFSGFTIIIACLGLFGLASFTAEQKTKEIGIRKVLGASSIQILLLLTTRFVKLVAVAILLAVPAAFLGIDTWLENFTYRVPMDWIIFVWAGIFIVVLTYIIVGLESLRASLKNPVDTIRYE